MKKNYNRIRLEHNEGRIRSEEETKRRHEWKDSVKDLPCQERPKKGELGYNKHFYEVDINGTEYVRFRLDVCDAEDTEITEENLREYVATKI